MLFRFLLSFFCLFPSSLLLFAGELNSYIDGREVVLDKVDGIVISGDNFFPPEYIIKTTNGVLFYRTNHPNSAGEEEKFAKKLGKELLHKPVTRSEIESCKLAVVDYFLNVCNKHVFVESFDRISENSVLVLKVRNSKVGDISVKGNKWFSKKHYLKQLHSMESEALNEDQLVADIDTINKNPWSKAEILYKKADKADKTNIELVVEDKNPISVYGGGDNSGVAATGYGRMFVGFDWGGILNTGHRVAFCYTSSPDLSTYNSYQVEYLLPLSKGGGLDLSGNYSIAHGDAALQRDEGVALEILGKFDLYLPQSLKKHQGLCVGVDFKTTNSDLLEGEMKVSPRYATIAALMAEYKGERRFGEHDISAKVSVSGQSWKIGSTMSESAYSLLRKDADPEFFITRIELGYQYHSKKNSKPSAKIKLSGQRTESKLLPTEQMGLGGAGSVRGYLDHSFNADSSVGLNFTIHTPGTSLFRYVANKYRHIDKLSGTLFLDGAYGWNNGDEALSRLLIGAGPGIGYSISQYLKASFDLGVRLGNSPTGMDEPRIQTYFSLQGNY